MLMAEQSDPSADSSELRLVFHLIKHKMLIAIHRWNVDNGFINLSGELIHAASTGSTTVDSLYLWPHNSFTDENDPSSL